MTKVLVTGASGFIGRALVPALVEAGHEVVAPARVETGEIGPQTEWMRWLEGADSVVHLAGLAHARHDEASLMRVNAEGTHRLAEQAAQAGVPRFVLMSSVKAAADRSNQPLTEADAPAPGGTYGRSKLEAERAVLSVGLAAPIVLRPPLVFAADARANFGALLHLADSPLPLPLESLGNRRSLLSRGSLVEAVLSVLHERQSLGGVFFVADPPALSTASIVRALRQGLGRSSRLFRARWLLGLAPASLTESLEVQDANFRSKFAFEGRDVHEALAATAAAWKARLR